MHNAVLQVPSDQIVPCSQAGMSDITEVVQGDFCKMPFGDNSFDAVFSVEATCHAGEVCFLALQNFHLPISVPACACGCSTLAMSQPRPPAQCTHHKLLARAALRPHRS